MDDAEAKRWTWAVETPNKSGFYWLYSEDYDPEVVRVVRGDDGITVYPAGTEEPYELAEGHIMDNMLWAGPLEPPAD